MREEQQEQTLSSEAATAVQQAYVLAFFSVPVLFIYAAAQAGLSFFLGAEHTQLKLVLEPNLLLLGLILHVQWRKVSNAFLAHDLQRPLWMAAGDCLSFVITFWALWALAEAFLQEAGLL
jgi:hypothetical protein